MVVFQKKILKVKPGVTSYAKCYIEDGNQLSFFRYLFNNSMINSIKKYNTYHGQLTDPELTVTVTVIEKLIGLQYMASNLK